MTTGVRILALAEEGLEVPENRINETIELTLLGFTAVPVEVSVRTVVRGVENEATRKYNYDNFSTVFCNLF